MYHAVPDHASLNGGMSVCFWADDWKADQYRWRNFGVKSFPAKCPVVRKTTFHVQCPDGAKDDFIRISYQLIEDTCKVIVQYLGNCEVAVQYPHGNCLTSERNHVRSCPSRLCCHSWKLAFSTQRLVMYINLLLVPTYLVIYIQFWSPKIQNRCKMSRTLSLRRNVWPMMLSITWWNFLMTWTLSCTKYPYFLTWA